MNTNISQIREKIKDELDSLTGIGGGLNYVYDYHKFGSEGYPYATFEPGNLSGNYETNNENLRNYRYNIFLYQEFSSIGRGEALSILLNCFDQIINKFDENYTLDGLVEEVEALQGEFSTIQNEDSKVLVCQIILNIRVLKNINN